MSRLWSGVFFGLAIMATLAAVCFADARLLFAAISVSLFVLARLLNQRTL